MATSGETSTLNKSSDEEDWAKAKIGIQLLINNKAKEAVDLFQKYPDSLPMFAGYSFAVFMDALMSFEEDKLNFATGILRELETKCTAASGGWLKSVKTKVFGGPERIHTLAENLETQIILADSLICMAILIFLQQDISGYFKGGWVLRKSWKVYQSVYNDLKNLYKDSVGELPISAVAGEAALTSKDSPESNATNVIESPPNGYPIKTKIPNSKSANLTQITKNTKVEITDCCSSGNSSPNSMKNNCSHRSSISNNNFTFMRKSTSVNSALSKHNKNHPNDGDATWSSKLSPFASSLSLALHIFSSSSTEKLKSGEIDKETVIRLMGAVSFGYGVFQLGISLLPPSLLKLTNFLGFGGNRQNGIDCLMYARSGVDMRAPLATLALLWYHTIVRPFYALDGSNVQAGVDSATQLLQESEIEYSQSALFLFFRGRVNRLNSDIPQALDSYQSAVDNATQREIKILGLHEVGWCHLIKLDYCAAEETFNYLKAWSRWSKAFYCYLAGICSGACENSANPPNFTDIRVFGPSIQKTVTQLEEFLARRAKCCVDDRNGIVINPVYWKLLVYEMLYLWNALPSCNRENIENIKKDCGTISSSGNREPMMGLSELILGSCYCIQRRQLEGAEHFRTCLELRKNLASNADDAHVSAFAQYELGTILLKSPETKDEGKSLLVAINQYKDYDFEQRLNVRVHSILKHV